MLLVLVYNIASYLLKICLKVKAGETRHMWKQQTKFYKNLRTSLLHSMVINTWKDRATSYELKWDSNSCYFRTICHIIRPFVIKLLSSQQCWSLMRNCFTKEVS
jgi:hypothetical protein